MRPLIDNTHIADGKQRSGKISGLIRCLLVIAARYPALIFKPAGVSGFIGCLLVIITLLPCGAVRAEDKALDQASGFVIDTGWELTNAHCAACHSARLVTQNRMDRSGWEDVIRLMQTEHGLWDLGEAEPVIIDYLTRHYGIAKHPARKRKGRINQEQRRDITPP